MIAAILGSAVGRLARNAGGHLGQPVLKEAPFWLGLRQVERAAVRVAGLGAAAGATQEVGARGVEVAVVAGPGSRGGTTLLFTHAGWQQDCEFMSGCSTNWGSYLTSLKAGAENDAFAAYPAGEISRWD
jgi:hypothetical protein